MNLRVIIYEDEDDDDDFRETDIYRDMVIDWWPRKGGLWLALHSADGDICCELEIDAPDAYFPDEDMWLSSTIREGNEMRSLEHIVEEHRFRHYPHELGWPTGAPFSPRYIP